MNILALDLATTTGYAHNRDGLHYGHVSLTPKKGEPKGVRFIRFFHWLRDMVKEVMPDKVVYEMPHHRGGQATRVPLGLRAYVEGECARHEIPCESVHSKAVKKYATGNGNAPKEDMIRTAEEKFGVQNLTDDEADALWILDFSLKGV